MRVHVVHPGLHMSSESRVVIKTKTHLALLPFEHRLREVRLSLAIGRGPSGQPVVQVVIEALLLPRGRVRLEEQHHGLWNAMEAAVDRIGPAVLLGLEGGSRVGSSGADGGRL